MQKYKDFILYIVFGVMTTSVNILVYYIAVHIMGFSTTAGTVAAWFLAVLFAYLTNRKWVFHSEAEGSVAIVREVMLFYGARLSTGFLDWLMMFTLVDLAGFNDIIIKAAANMIVIIVNYIASKLLIFKRKSESQYEK